MVGKYRKRGPENGKLVKSYALLNCLTREDKLQEQQSSKEAPAKAAVVSGLAEYFSDAPRDVQELILMKLAKDRKSFAAFCFASKSNLKLICKPSFWRELMTREGRKCQDWDWEHWERFDIWSMPMLTNLYYRRVSRSAMTVVRMTDQIILSSHQSSPLTGHHDSVPCVKVTCQNCVHIPL